MGRSLFYGNFENVPPSARRRTDQPPMKPPNHSLISQLPVLSLVSIMPGYFSCLLA
jgi:hypothetical protein